MKEFVFNQMDNSIQLQFICPQCDEENITDPITVPEPNYEAENNAESRTFNDATHECTCGQVFNIEISNSMAGGDGSIEELNNDADIAVIENIADE